MLHCVLQCIVVNAQRRLRNWRIVPNDAERLGIVGLSGGGPYALACGALAPLVARMSAVAVLDGTVPSVVQPVAGEEEIGSLTVTVTRP
jgi:cephalosporin-C deacetylase-like acetyl esterase